MFHDDPFYYVDLKGLIKILKKFLLLPEQKYKLIKVHEVVWVGTIS